MSKLRLKVVPDRTGKLVNNYHRQAIQGYLKANAGCYLQITIEPPTRSNEQNALLWGFIYPPIQKASYDAGHPVATSELHEYFKRKYLPQDTVDWQGETIIKEPTTTKLEPKEFSEYVEKIMADDKVLAMGVDFGEYFEQRG